MQSLLRDDTSIIVPATSLQALGLSGERVWPVRPLAVPEATSAFNGQTLARFAATESVRFFVERAKHAHPAFTLTEQNALAVSAICRRMDGLPLAIELAAARLRLLSPGQIAERLEDAAGLLTRGEAEDPRHHTLRATLEWSWGLLDTAEQTLLRRRSVFSGSFSLEAAEAVGQTPAGEPAVLDTLADLVDKSLVNTRHTGLVLPAILALHHDLVEAGPGRAAAGEPVARVSQRIERPCKRAEAKGEVSHQGGNE